tara:strand:- start:247 stop:636 length:390 start_codon:yes stop_codon:yes gene_type:complete
MLDKFRGDSNAFLRGDDDHEAYVDMINSGLLILTRAYHANHGFDQPDADDADAVSTVLNWMVEQDANQITSAAYDAKATEIADQLVAKGGLNGQERDDFISFAQLCRPNISALGNDMDDDRGYNHLEQS